MLKWFSEHGVIDWLSTHGLRVLVIIIVAPLYVFDASLHALTSREACVSANEGKT